MTKAPKKQAVAGEIAEAGQVLSLSELCVICRVEETWVSELVAHGAIHPVDRKKATVSASAVLRVKKAQRLARDFDLNTPGVALALDLLDEIERLRAHIRSLSPRGERSDAR